MVVLQSMWKGPNLCLNFMEPGYESATYEVLFINCLKDKEEKNPRNYFVFLIEKKEM